MKKIKRIWKLVLLVVFAAGLCGGCVSMQPQKFENQLHQWVPLGTTEKEARRIMEHQGFDCDLVKQDNRFNRYGRDYLDCARTQVWFHDWSAVIFLNNGKVSGYGPVHVE